jgi:hypothetical protein
MMMMQAGARADAEGRVVFAYVQLLSFLSSRVLWQGLVEIRILFAETDTSREKGIKERDWLGRSEMVV